MLSQQKTTSRWKSHPLSCMTCDDGGWDSDHPCVVGIVRCADGDIDSFDAGAEWALICFRGDLEGRKPLPPSWAWWRWNPDWSREYNAILAQASGPGRGNWRGAIILLPPIAADPAVVVDPAVGDKEATK